MVSGNLNCNSQVKSLELNYRPQVLEFRKIFLSRIPFSCEDLESNIIHLAMILTEKPVEYNALSKEYKARVMVLESKISEQEAKNQANMAGNLNKKKKQI